MVNCVDDDSFIANIYPAAYASQYIVSRYESFSFHELCTLLNDVMFYEPQQNIQNIYSLLKGLKYHQKRHSKMTTRDFFVEVVSAKFCQSQLLFQM